jgi:Tfp pilus assembly protein PilO
MMSIQRPRIISSLILMVAIFWGSHEVSQRYYFAPLEEEFSKRSQKFEELRRSNDENEKVKENAEQLEQALKEAEHRYDSLKPLLPPEAELPRVFDWIARRALERNLKLEHFSQGARAGEKETISEIPLQVEVLGNYDGVSRFLEDFARFERVLRVRGVHMFQEQQQLSPIATMRANINFSAYISK